MPRRLLMLSATLTLITTPAFAGDSDCALHKRLSGQKTQSAAVIQTSAQTPITPHTVASSTVISLSSRINRPAAVPPSAQPQTGFAAGEGDNPVILQAQSNYGSGSPAPTAKKPMVEKTSAHAEFTNILQKYVSPPDDQGLTHFAYGKLKANSSDKAALDNYIKTLERVNPSTLPRNDAIAYYANLYNAVTVQVVVDNYPVKSIRKLGPLSSGPWKKNLLTINGVASSLNDVEHEILRKQFPSPYIHYMVNCASVGCPNLLNSAWDGRTIDRVKVKAAEDYINSPRGVQITSKGLKVSSIFKWFKEDFGGKSGLLKHIRQHARPELAQAIDNGAQVVDYGYDWSLNE